jgi:hypothetical protein
VFKSSLLPTPKMTLNLGNEFDTLYDVRKTIKQHIIERDESFKVLKGKQSKLHVVVCIDKTYNFHIHVFISKKSII